LVREGIQGIEISKYHRWQNVKIFGRQYMVLIGTSLYGLIFFELDALENGCVKPLVVRSNRMKMDGFVQATKTGVFTLYTMSHTTICKLMDENFGYVFLGSSLLKQENEALATSTSKNMIQRRRITQFSSFLIDENSFLEDKNGETVKEKFRIAIAKPKIRISLNYLCFAIGGMTNMGKSIF
jgi:hypothetical protein